MNGQSFNHSTVAVDARRDLVIPGNKKTTIQFSVEHFIALANEAIKAHEAFFVALSGGSTPKAIYEVLADEKNQDRLDWTRVILFWSDERAVGPNHPDSNYKMAMEAGFDKLPIPKNKIFRMVAEQEIEKSALAYEQLIEKTMPQGFDLVMLGLGEDGHTASLFPKTHGLHAQERLVVANYIPSMNTWRMTLTYHCINHARNTVIYVLGPGKANILKRALSTEYEPDTIPVQRVGTATNRALYICDNDAAAHISHPRDLENTSF